MLSSLLLVMSLASCGFSMSLPIKRQSDVDSFIDSQKSISLAGVLDNIGGLNSTFADGADPGMVVASPSTVNPNYFYTWTRGMVLLNSLPGYEKALR